MPVFEGQCATKVLLSAISVEVGALRAVLGLCMHVLSIQYEFRRQK